MDIILADKIHQKAFSRALCVEHYEEASALFELRMKMLTNLNTPWTAIEAFETRLEAHIYGLALEYDIVFEIYMDTPGMNFGEQYAAMRVFSSKGRMDLIKKMMASQKIKKGQHLFALSAAFCHGLTAPIIEQCLIFLIEDRERYTDIAAEIISYHRIKLPIMLHSHIDQAEPGIQNHFFKAFGRLGDSSLQKRALSVLSHEDPSFIYVAALYLLRIGNFQTIHYCRNHCQPDTRLLRLFGISCGLSDCLKFIQKAKRDPSPDAMIALGLAGHTAAVEFLLTQLGNSDLSESSALSLNLICGANIYEDFFIPEEIDKDELFEDEIKKLDQGESLYPEEEQPGETITRISQQPGRWSAWWNENKAKFKPGIRYRNGKPFSLRCLLENLESESVPRFIRQLAYEELVIRYHIDFPFETDMFVVQQKKSIRQFHEWLTRHPDQFQDGKWYFAGKVIETN